MPQSVLAGALTFIVGGGLAGQGELVCNGCDQRGFRNIQLGSPADPNGDISAGQGGQPGTLSLQHDNGDQVVIGNGDGHSVMLRVKGRCVYLPGQKFCKPRAHIAKPGP